MRDNGFLDTNVLVYANDTAEPAKQATARKLIRDVLYAETAGCTILYSENLNAGQEYAHVTVVNPFAD